MHAHIYTYTQNGAKGGIYKEEDFCDNLSPHSDPEKKTV